MKKHTTYCVVSLLIFSLFGCSKPKPTGNHKPEDTSNPDVASSLFPPTKELDHDIQWKEWESTPFSIKTVPRAEYFEEQKAEYFIKGTYPQIDGFNDPSLENKVNLWLKNAINQKIDPWKSYFIGGKEVYLQKLKEKDSITPLQCSFSFSYQIALLNSDFLSVIFNINEWWGSHASYDTATTVDIDLKNGILLKVDDLFTSKSFWDVLKPVFQRELEKQQGEPFNGSGDLFTYQEISPYISFALLPDALLIIYDENEVMSLEGRKQVSIPIKNIKNLLVYRSFPQSFSYFSAPEGWSAVNNQESDDIFSPYEHSNPRFMIKLPNTALGKDDKKFQILDKGTILFQFPVIQEGVASIQISYKEINSTFNPTNTIQYLPKDSEIEKKG